MHFNNHYIESKVLIHSELTNLLTTLFIANIFLKSYLAYGPPCTYEYYSKIY